MKSTNRCLVPFAVSVGIASFASAAIENFGALRPGPLPSDWQTVVAGGFSGGKRTPGIYEEDMYGEAAKRLVVTPSAIFQIVEAADSGAKKNVLQVRAEGTDAWCVKSGVKIRDGYVEARGRFAKPVAQHRFFQNPKRPHLGVVWRYQNPKNFYCAWVGDGVGLKLFKMVDGDFEDVEAGPYTYIDDEKWHTVRVEFTGGTTKVMLDGSELYSAVDRDIHKAGAVGIYLIGDGCSDYDYLSHGALATSGFENFEGMTVGSPPPRPWLHGNCPDLARPEYPLGTEDWQIYRIRHPRPGTNVLRISTLGSHPYCVKSDVQIRDGYVEVEAMPVAGEFYRSAGVIWRFQDEKNYYGVRLNAAEKDYALLFKFVNGRRSGIGRSLLLSEHEVSTNRWLTLRVEYSGNNIDVFLNGRKIVSATDDAITNGGAVGVWTKHDSHTYFDNLSWGGK